MSWEKRADYLLLWTYLRIDNAPLVAVLVVYFCDATRSAVSPDDAAFLTGRTLCAASSLARNGASCIEDSLKEYERVSLLSYHHRVQNNLESNLPVKHYVDHGRAAQ
jgi:hypothetical protein